MVWRYSMRQYVIACGEFMTTPWHGNVFRITGTLWGNPPVTGGFPSQRASNEELWYFILSLNELLNKHPKGWWIEMYRRPFDVIVLWSDMRVRSHTEKTWNTDGILWKNFYIIWKISMWLHSSAAKTTAKFQSDRGILNIDFEALEILCYFLGITSGKCQQSLLVQPISPYAITMTIVPCFNVSVTRFITMD